MRRNQGRQLDFCDVCGDHTHKVDLVRTQMRYLRPAGQNRFPWDKYHATYWACDASDKSTISIGPWVSRCRVNDDNTVTEIDGYQTWDGDGTFRLIDSIDISGWTNLTMSASVGPYHASEDPELTVVMGCCNSDASVKYSQRTWTIKNDQRCWFTATVADLVTDGVTSSAAYFYIDVTNDEYWYVSNLQLEADVSSPGTFVPNETGASSVVTEQTELSVVKTCKKHREKLVRDSKLIGTPRTDDEGPIRVVIQEN